MPSPRFKSTTLWVLLASAVPLLVLLVFILRYSVPVVSSDSWGLVPYVEEVLLRRNIDLPILFGQTINEHRIALPLFFTFATALLTGWNLTAELLLTPLAAAASFFLLSFLAHRTLHIHGKWEKALVLFVFSSLVFSIAHRWLWFVSIYSAVWVCNAFFLGAVVLTRCRALRFPRILAIITLCFSASFSFGYGLLSWIAIAPLFVTQWFQADNPKEKERRALLAVLFLVAGVATWVLYLHDFSLRPYHPSPLHFLGNPGTFFLFILTLAGFPLSIGLPTMSPFIGALLGIGTLFLLQKAYVRHKNTPLLSPWMSIVLFSWLSMALIAIGRSGFGLGTALGHRYLPISTLGIIGLLGLLALVYSHRRTVLVTTLLTVAIIVLLPSLKEPQAWQSISASMRQGLACLQTYPIASDACLRKLNSPYPRKIREKFAPILARLGVLVPFILPADTLWERNTTTAFGAWENDISVSADYAPHTTIILASGWARLPSCKVPEHIVLTYGKRHRLLAHTAAVLPRDDIARTFGACHRISGWSVEIAAEDFARAQQEGPLSAWVYDGTQNRLLHLPNFSQPLPSPLPPLSSLPLKLQEKSISN